MFTPHHVAQVTCHISSVTVCFFYKVVELFVGASVINEAYPVLFLLALDTGLVTLLATPIFPHVLESRKKRSPELAIL